MAKEKAETNEAPAPAEVKTFANQIELGTGCHILGKSTTLSRKDSILEVTALGIHATSLGSGRVVLIPWSNIRCIELKAAAPRKPGTMNRLR